MATYTLSSPCASSDLSTGWATDRNNNITEVRGAKTPDLNLPFTWTLKHRLCPVPWGWGTEPLSLREEEDCGNLIVLGPEFQVRHFVCSPEVVPFGFKEITCCLH